MGGRAGTISSLAQLTAVRGEKMQQEFGLVQDFPVQYCTGKKTITGHTGHTGHKRITRTVRLSVLEESFWIAGGGKMGDSQMFVNGQMNVND